MARINSYIKNAIAQLFDEIEDKCHVKFATFTASDSQGQKNLAAGTRTYMEDKPNNESNGIYKYLYDPAMSFDFRFHQRLAAAPFIKTSKPWATIMFSTKQVRTLTNVLSHLYTRTIYVDGSPVQFKTRMVSVPVNMAIISNDMDKLYNTTEKVAMYFDRFINYHYDHAITFGNVKNGGYEIYENVAGRAANIREVDLDKLDTENRGALVSSAFQFDLIYWVCETPGTRLRLLKKIILELQSDDGGYKDVLEITEEDLDDFEYESDIVDWDLIQQEFNNIPEPEPTETPKDDTLSDWDDI